MGKGKAKIGLGNPQCLCRPFKSFQDVLDFISQGVKRSSDWLLSHDINRFIKGYYKGNVYIAISPYLTMGTEKYDLIFCVIPPHVRRNLSGTPLCNSSLNLVKTNKLGSKQAVLICSTYPVQCPEQIVPSFVWLEPHRKRDNLWREILESSVQHTIKLRDIISKRKLRFELGTDKPTGNGKIMPSNVKGCPEIVNNISSKGYDFLRRSLCNFDFMQIAIRIRGIGLNNVGLFCILFEESPNLFLKCKDMSLCLCETDF